MTLSFLFIGTGQPASWVKNVEWQEVAVFFRQTDICIFPASKLVIDDSNRGRG